jgi:trimeric autotransporter adhesin
MKAKIIFMFIFNFFVCSLQFSQNITNTLGTNGTFTIKDGTTNYFTLTQSSGQVNILKTLRLENTTASDVGVLYMGTNRFMHNYGSNNMFIGVNSGNFSLTGADNTAFGSNTSTNITTGNSNSSFGYVSLSANTTGTNNNAFGKQSLYFNTTGSNNSAFGRQALYSNVSGSNNSAFGYLSMNYNTASNNSAFGYGSLYNNNTGTGNSAFGYYSLYTNTDGIRNTAFGYQSLYNTTGDTNTAIGYNAGSNITTGGNNICIGFNSQVPSNTSSGQVKIGNSNTNYAGIQVAWTITSDRKFKTDILNSKLGLGFISKLRPVSYTRINDEHQKTEYGFVAQEVEEVLKNEGVENSGILTIDDEGTYNMRYNDLIAPMVKAIQELKTENNELKNEIEKLKTIQDKVNALEKLVNELKQTDTKQTNAADIKFSGK